MQKKNLPKGNVAKMKEKYIMKYNNNSGKMENNDGQSGGFPEPINITNSHLVKLWHKLLGTTNVQATTEEFFQGLSPSAISLSMSSAGVKVEKYTHQFESAYLQLMGAWRAMVRSPVFVAAVEIVMKS